MKKRYRILRIAIVLLKVQAVLTVMFFLVRAAIIHTLVVAVFQGFQIQADPSVILAIADVVQVVVAFWLAVLIWGLGDYLRAGIDTEENTRATAMLLRRLAHHQVPDAEPEYMKSLNGMWDDEPQRPTPAPANKMR